MGLIETPQPSQDLTIDLRDRYTRYYNAAVNQGPDSHIRSRQIIISELIQSVYSLSSEFQSPFPILSVGAGRQIVELELRRHPDWRNLAHRVNLVTLDAADIYKKNLLVTNSEQMQHISADGSFLPFADDSFPIVYSNVAIDFMPRKAFNEVARVLMPRGIFIANLHHPNIIFGKQEEKKEPQRKKDQEEKYLPLKQDLKSIQRALRKIEEYEAIIEDIDATIKFQTRNIFSAIINIEEFMNSHFTYDSLRVEEHEYDAYNGSYFIVVKGMREKVFFSDDHSAIVIQ